jgi:hypothetical protein
VLDVACEGLPLHRRVIRVPDVLSALWRADLLHVPVRLERLVQWIFDRDELADEDRSDVLGRVAEQLAKEEAKKVHNLLWHTLAKGIFAEPERSFKKPTGWPNDMNQVTLTAEMVCAALDVLLAEVFQEFVATVQRLREGIKHWRKVATPVAADNLDVKVAAELLPDALSTLSLGLILWQVLAPSPADNQFLVHALDRASKQAPGAGKQVSEAKTEGARLALAIILAHTDQRSRSLRELIEDQRGRHFFRKPTEIHF